VTALLLPLALLIPISSSLVQTGDREFYAINYPVAITLYSEALAADPDNPAIHWRLARVYVTSGEVAPESEREQIYRKAESHARRCIALDSTIAEGHTWLAAALGNIALFVGGSTKIKLANEIKAELDHSLALSEEDDVTWSILGSFYYSVGAVSWFERQMANIFLSSIPEGGFEESEYAFRRAIAIAPDIPRHRFELGKVYLEWGREEDGYRMFESALQLAPTSAGDTVARRVMQEYLRERDPER